MTEYPLLGLFRCEGCWRLYGVLTFEVGRIPKDRWSCECGGYIEEITPFMHTACHLNPVVTERQGE